MLKPLIRTIDRWRFELPLALALGAAAAFVTIAAPHALFDFASSPTIAIIIQSVFAALVAIAATAAAYFAMRRPPESQFSLVDEDDDENEEAPAAFVPTVDPAIRVRRADAHPDAPPREPIRASRDLGEPFMEIGTVALSSWTPEPVVEEPVADVPVIEDVTADEPFAETPVTETEPDVLDEAPEASSVPEEPIAPVAETPIVEEAVAVVTEWPLPKAAVDREPAIEAKAEPDVEHEAPTSREPDPIAAFEPEAEPAPAPVRPGRTSLSSMMDRLSDGLERRGGSPVAPPPALVDRLRDPRPELRDALEELNRLAARRD